MTGEYDLLLKLQQGDVNSFTAIYDKYHKYIYGYIQHFLKDNIASEDLLQDVFIKLWNARMQIDPQRPFTPYLYRIVRNSLYTALKRKALEKKAQQHLALAEYKDVKVNDSALEWKQYEQILHEAINKLPAQRRKVFQLCRTEGYSYNDAAQELGISTNTVKEHMVMAMKSIKSQVFTKAEFQLENYTVLFIAALLTTGF